MNDNDDEQDIRAMVRRAALRIEVQDRESQVLSPGSGGRPRSRGRLIPLTMAAATGAILVVIALVRTAGSGPVDSAPAASPPTLTSQDNSAMALPDSAAAPGTTTDEGWTAGTEITSAVKDGVPAADLRKITSRTAQLLQSGDVQGLLDIQRPDLSQRTRTADLVTDLGGHPTRLSIYFDVKQPEDRFVAVAYSIDCETSGLRASITLTYGRYEGAWYLNLATGIGGIMSQEVDTTTGAPPTADQKLSCVTR